MCFILHLVLYPWQHIAASNQHSPCDYARLHPGWTILHALSCLYRRTVTFVVPRCGLCGPLATLPFHAHTLQHATRDVSSASAGHRHQHDHHQHSSRLHQASRRYQHDHHQYSNRLPQAPRQYQYRDNMTYSNNTTSNQPITLTRSPTFTRDARRTLIAEVSRLAIQRSQRIERLRSRLPRLNTSLPHPYSDLRSEPNEDGNSSPPHASSRSVNPTTTHRASMQPDQHSTLSDRPRSRKPSRRSPDTPIPQSSPDSPTPIVESTRISSQPIMQHGVERTNQPTWPPGTLWNNSGRQLGEHRSAPRRGLRPASVVVAEDQNWSRSRSGRTDREHQERQDGVRTFILPIREKVPYSNANGRSRSAEEKGSYCGCPLGENHPPNCRHHRD